MDSTRRRFLQTGIATACLPAVVRADNAKPSNHWGNGELGNNGVHALDIVRWGLGAGLPRKATCSGGRYHFDDDQETPDTTLAVFDFGDASVIWDGSMAPMEAPRR